MPRVARVKHPGAILHIMIRSISEVPLFKDNRDRNKYLELLKKYMDLYRFRLYAYCLMTTHAHFIIDCSGADISKIMKSINQSYAMYYNKRHNRHGHLFQDRFKSKIVNSDRYLMMLSAYIHNNPKDIKAYKNDVAKYPYSSLSIYLGKKVDTLKILDANYILQQFGSDIMKARKKYLELLKNVYQLPDSVELEKAAEFIPEENEYRSEKPLVYRDFSLASIKDFITSYLGQNFNLHLKYNHKNNELKSLFIVLARSLSNLTLKDICITLKNLTLSSVWRLSQKGSDLILSDPKYKNIIDDFLKENVAVG
ncbi:MAG: transposase [Clostridia bacterium]|jgi:REP element-mobilizing transposase RayT|nr:transposase [Clostridia bacterium]